MIDTEKIVFRTMDILNTTTQVEVSSYFGVNSKQVTDWKKGNSNPPYPKLINLANEKLINLNWYFNGIGSKYLEDKNNDNLLNHQSGGNNHFSISINATATELEKNELQEIAELLDYTPKVFITQFIEKMRDFKKQCEKSK
jgi:transcriptional regulator with XRE-family HTH domain